jgi:hypothetical protein
MTPYGAHGFISRRLADEQTGKHAYTPWIEMYAGAEFADLYAGWKRSSICTAKAPTASDRYQRAMRQVVLRRGLARRRVIRLRASHLPCHRYPNEPSPVRVSMKSVGSDAKVHHTAIVPVTFEGASCTDRVRNRSSTACARWRHAASCSSSTSCRRFAQACADQDRRQAGTTFRIEPQWTRACLRQARRYSSRAENPSLCQPTVRISRGLRCRSDRILTYSSSP